MSNEKNKENKMRIYCTCHAVCGIVSCIYGVSQSAAENKQFFKLLYFRFSDIK